MLFLVLPPVPGGACVGHSGRDPHAGEDEFLEDDPEDEKTDQHEYFLHTQILLIIYLAYMRKIAYNFVAPMTASDACRLLVPVPH